MSLDSVDTIKSTFGRFKTETGLKLTGAFFALQLVNLLLTQYGMTAGGALGTVSALVSVLVGVAGIVLAIGAFRVLDSGEIRKNYFTTDLLWPFLRATGANIVTTVFLLIGAYIAMIPVLALGGGAALLTGGLGAGGASMSPVLLAAAGLLMLAFSLYPLYTLVTSAPMIILDGNRMFEALDRSVQRSKGEKLSMFFASLPVAVLYAVNIATALIGFGSGSPVGLLVSAVVSSVTGVAFVSLLVDYNQNLPE